MRALILILTMSLSLLSHSQEAPLISKIDVKDIDKSLPSSPLDSWLLKTLPKGWEVSQSNQLTGCGEISGDPNQQEYPLCIEVELSKNEKKEYLYINVGNSVKGIYGKPVFYWGTFNEKTVYKLSHFKQANM